MSVKKFFKDLGTREDIEDRDEDYGDAYSDDDYDSRDRRRGDRRRADSRYADEDDVYYEPSRSGSRRRSSEDDDYDEPRRTSDDEDDYYGGSRRSDSRSRREEGRTDRRHTDDRAARRGDGRAVRPDDRSDDRDEADYADAEYYDPSRERRRPSAGGRRAGVTEKTATKKAPSVLCFLPDTYMACREELVAGLKEGNVVVVDMRKLEPAAMMRLLDFMSGVGQALEADMFRLDDSTMIVLTREEIELDVDDLLDRMGDDEESDEETDADIDEEMDEEMDEELLDDESDDAEDDDL